MLFQAQFEEYMRGQGVLGFAMKDGAYASPHMRISYHAYLERHVLKAAVHTLEGLGYTYHGGEAWKPPVGPVPFMHKKSGRLYQLIGPAHIQSDQPLSDMAVVQVYRDINTTGELWVREAGEFNERFEQL
jgi:hypothetical protein